jgi:phosphate/sulfate permease
MIDIYLIIIFILAGLAISDLIVGVSNDAVNFLNSALGSKAVKYKIAMVVASVGILIGTTFSGGMMEVARKSIFNPSQFYFNEIIIIFLAVMLTDVILLDFFNTFGLPTSTTVSLVFELLGASVAISLIKISHSAESLQDIGKYINSGRTLLIIAGILLSVIIAFSVASIIQFITRIIFTFNYKKTIRYFGAIFGGIALTSMVYFILIEGAKGVSFLTDEHLMWIHDNKSNILLGTLVGGTVLLQVLILLFNFNVFRFTVLLGTGTLALAFAGNDLVNFIGVPIAGYESYRLFTASGGSDPTTFLMGGLQSKIQSPTVFLIMAGFIMIITLFFSRKARSVINTSLNLSHQEDTVEIFESSVLARSLVRIALSVGNFFELSMPKKVNVFIKNRLNPDSFKKAAASNPVSFDLVRAAVNLVVASILIAFGTSQKLPLSTTYVTFMVAMGTSMADGAWNRETAVYRVNGMITVIAGWFFTALVAFVVALTMALILYYGKLFALIILIFLALFLVYHTHIIHHRRSEKQKKSEKEITDNTRIDNLGILKQCIDTVINTLERVMEIYQAVIKGLIDEKRKKLKNAWQDAKQLNDEIIQMQENVYYTIKKLQVEESMDSGHYYVRILEHLRDLTESMTFISKPAFKHVDNNHAPLKAIQTQNINDFTKKFVSLIQQIKKTLIENIDDSQKVKSNVEHLLELLVKYKKENLKMIKAGQISTRISLLYMDILTESRNLVIELMSLYEDSRAFVDYSVKQNKNINSKTLFIPR